MKRKIKFRGQRVDSNEWIYGNLLIEDNHTYIATGSLHIEVSPETVGQFTGLKDRNEVEVYEGDEVASVFEDIGSFDSFDYIEEFRNRDTSKSKLAYEVGTIEMVNGHYMLVMELGGCHPISNIRDNINEGIAEHSDTYYYEVINNKHKELLK